MAKKLTQEEFIKRANIIYKNKYDYSKTIYNGIKSKVIIICPIHGEFIQRADNHLEGRGCKKCNGFEITTKEFIQRAKKVHGNKYDYSLVDYKGMDFPVEIICPIHGKFKTTPRVHLRGCDCQKCGNKKKGQSHASTTKEFIEKANNIHGNKYDYSLVNYVDSHTKVKIICPNHGVFEQEPANHLQGSGCPICANNILLTTEEFVEKAKSLYGDKFDYSLANYKGANTKVKIICPMHGVFTITPSHFLKGQNCPICRPSCLKERLTAEQFVKASKKKYGNNKFDYSFVNYVNYNTPVELKCLKHNYAFSVTPDSHLRRGRNSGCPHCKESFGEKEVRVFLENKNIKFEEQKRFKELGRLSYDFYLPELNILIEYQGEQHYMPVCFGGCSKKQAEKNLHLQRHHDWLKRDYAKKHNIKLLVIPYWENVEELLSKNLPIISNGINYQVA